MSQQTTDNIASEALFELTNGERFFFGVRNTHLSKSKKLHALCEIPSVCHKGDGLNDVVNKIRGYLENAQLAETPPDYCELGVFQLWNRVKPLIVWRKNNENALMLPDDMPQHEQKPDEGFPALDEPQIEPLMLEAAWARNPDNNRLFPCWISRPVSEQKRLRKICPCSKTLCDGGFDFYRA